MQNRVACVQMTSTHDVKQNLDMAKELIEEAVASEARLVASWDLVGGWYDSAGGF
jgi:predicted amidohydrolase